MNFSDIQIELIKRGYNTQIVLNLDESEVVEYLISKGYSFDEGAVLNFLGKFLPGAGKEAEKIAAQRIAAKAAAKKEAMKGIGVFKPGTAPGEGVKQGAEFAAFQKKNLFKENEKSS